MTVYQSKTGKWYMYMTIRGKRYHKAIPEAVSKKDAEKGEAVFKSELLQGKFNLADNKGEMLFKNLVEKYKEYSRAVKLPSSWHTEEFKVNVIAEYFKNKTLNDITPAVIERFRLHRKNTPKPDGTYRANATINRDLAILRKMFNIAVDNNWIDDNPCSSRKIKKLREDSMMERYLSPDEEKKLFEACKNEYAYLAPIFLCALHTGMRRSEILNLKWKFIDFKRGFITVTKTKSGKDRKIPLSPRLLNLLKELHQDTLCEYVFPNPLTLKPYVDIKRSYATVLEKAEIDSLRFHDLRHTAATRMVASNIDLVVVQDILGHSQISTTMRYSHPLPERKLQAIQALANFA